MTTTKKGAKGAQLAPSAQKTQGANVNVPKKEKSRYSVMLEAFQDYKNTSKSVGSARALLIENRDKFDAKGLGNEIDLLIKSKKLPALYKHIADGVQKTKKGTTCPFWVMRYVVKYYDVLSKVK